MSAVRKTFLVSVSCAVLAAMTACAAPPTAGRPMPETPATFSADLGRGVEAGGAVDARWWEAFHDPVLDDLVRRAIDGNPDLAVAAARVREARALAGIADAGRLPSVDARGGATNTVRSDRAEPQMPGSRTSDDFQAGFDASWEIDLFGRASNEAKAAAADAAAADEDRRAALVSLRAEVVRAYASLRGSQRTRAVIEASLDAARSTVALTRDRADAGLATDLDVTRAEAQAAAVQATVAPVAETIEREMHRLAILCGETPGALVALLSDPAPLTVVQPRVTLGTPAETIARRPDLRREARRVDAELARTGVARADLYPHVSLAAAFGLEGGDPADLVRPDARTRAVGPAVRWALFDGGRARNGVAAADARLDAAREAHRAALLRALGEVEDALTGYLRGWDRRDAQASAVESRRRAVALAEDSHRSGLVPFLDVLDAQRSLYDAEADLARTDTETAERLVALHKALGGGAE